MIDYLIDLFDLFMDTRVNPRRKLRKLQKEGIDLYVWLLKGTDTGSYPCSDQAYGLEKFLINVFGYKSKDESSKQYIDSSVQKGRIIRDDRNIIVKKKFIELNFEIERETLSKRYEPFTFPYSRTEKPNPTEVAGNVEVRSHQLYLMYTGWNYYTNLLVRKDQFLQKPSRIEFLDEEPLQ